MDPIGYIVAQDIQFRNRSTKWVQKWIGQIPSNYRKFVLDEASETTENVNSDEHCLAVLKHYRSLMPMAQESRKPLFHLKPADGALGAHTYAVRDAYNDFRQLSLKIVRKAGIVAPE